MGALALIESAYLGLSFLAAIFRGDILLALFGVSLLVGAGCNVTLFVWTPRWLSRVTIFIPWITFLTVILFSPGHLSPFGMLFFYPWAASIALIHIARLHSHPFPARASEATGHQETPSDRVA